jgi:hypothetical protein
MKRSLGLAVATSLTALVVGASPASAQQLTIADPAGDAANGGPDITDVTFRNLDNAVRVTVTFVRTMRGNMIVSVDPRHATGVRMVSEYRPAGHTTNVVLPHAFTDRQPGRGAEPCRGFRVRWSPDAPTATFRMPSRCLHDGDYGALRFVVLTEHGSDSDFAPSTPRGTDWVPRG